MKITFLGTNGWYDTDTGNTTCILIETKNSYIILDAGNGIYKIGKYIKAKKPVYLFLSHFHLDHIVGLHILVKFNFLKGLKIFGPENSEKILKKIINEPFTIPFNKLPFPVEIKGLKQGNYKEPFAFTCKKLLHSSNCLGYKFSIEGKNITYCSDTGLCDNVYKLAQNTDLLIAECSYKTGEKNVKWPHLNPQDAASIAKRSNVKKLILTHFVASLYLTLASRKVSEIAAKRIFKNTLAAKDGMMIEF